MKFEKVSKEQWVKDTGSLVGYDTIQLPVRATSGSAGYDFKTPSNYFIPAGETVLIPTGIRAQITDGWVLQLYPRSGLGFKYRLQLNNTVGIIDADYYHAKNEGHIFIKMTNCGNKDIALSTGDGFAQGIFYMHGITEDDEATGIREGGMGSTDKK